MTQTGQLVYLPLRPVAEPAPILRPVPAPLPPRRRRYALSGATRAVARALVVLLALAAPIAAFAGEHNVQIDVEGRTKSVRTYAVTAKALLQRQGIKVRRTDLVLPAHRLRDGDRVVFRRAKHLTVVVDGHRRRVLAHGLSVGEAMRDLGLVAGPKDHVWPDPQTKLTPSTEIYVRNAIHAVVRVDGLRRDIVSSADSVRHLLRQANIWVGGDDYVFPSRSAVPYDGMWIRVVRVRRITETRSVTIPYSYITRQDSSLASGERRVVQDGREGLSYERYSVLIEDGTRVSETLLDRQTVRYAHDYIVRVGTKAPEFHGSGGSNEGEASWFAADGLIAAHRTLPIGSTVKVTDRMDRFDFRTRQSDLAARPTPRPTSRNHSPSGGSRSVGCAHREGIPTTCPNRTLLDLASVLRCERLEACIDEAILGGLTTSARAIRYLEERGLRHRPGAGMLFDLLVDRRSGALQKELERMFVRKIKQSRLPMPVRQRREGNRKIDFAYPDARIALELDGRNPHSSGAVFRDDRRRQNELVLAGWIPLRFTWVDVDEHWDVVQATIESLLPR
ncbi:MAG: ubiquitin-like domain-containing protein [Actinobacteria bacterium]|nr:ubiquitin-like domain-containing protein [Actinomycetota bacterium]